MKMATRTWEIKIGGKIVKIKALKEIASRIADRLSKPLDVCRYKLERTGIKGGKIYETLLYTPFSITKSVGEGYENDIQEYINSIPETLDFDNAKAIEDLVEKADVLFKKYVPTDDKTRTEEEERQRIEERDRQMEEVRRKQEDRYSKFLDTFGKREKVKTNDMAVILRVTFNDSHSMSDYYADHRSIGCDLLLADVPKQARTEKLACSILARYLELNKLQWEWHVEEYSGGNGTYLESEYFGEWEHKAYDGRDKVSIKYEISFNPYNPEVYLYRDYPGITIQEPITSDTKATMYLNTDKNGVEIKFPGKPSSEVIQSLKSNGFRWSYSQGLWYAKQSEATIEFAKRLAS